MNYNQQEKIKDLQRYISTHTLDKKNNNKEKDALESEIEWNASLFFAKAIHLAQPREKDFSLEQFKKFKKDYESSNDKQIDTDKFFENFWLRNVLGKIKIAGTVSSACFSFDRISSYKNELEFLFNKFPDGKEGKSKITKVEFNQIKEQYEIETNLILNEEGIYKQNWLSEKDDNIQVSNINYYFKFYLDYWEEFQFLSSYKKQISKDEDKGLKINTDEFNQLHQSFSLFYSKTPPIQKLINEQVLKIESEYCYINFHNTEIRYWSALEDQITAHYWQLLIEDNNFSTDKEKVKIFLKQILFFGWSFDFLIYTINEAKTRFLNAAFDLVLNEPDLDGLETEFKKVSIDGESSSNKVELLFHDREEYNDFSLNNEDYFELLESLETWEKKAQTTYLLGQSSRKEISFLVNIIVAHDYEFEREENQDQDNPTTHYYKRIFTLLKKALDKPTLLWNIKCYAIMYRREIIPYLIKDSSYTSLAFSFIEKMGDHIFNEERELVSKKLWTKSVDLALFTVRSCVKDGDASKIIFQIYRKLNCNKYDIPYNRHRSVEKRNRQEKKAKEDAILSLIEDSLLYNHKVHGENERYLIPEIFNELVTLFIKLPSKPLYNNGTVSFPMLQWDGLTWLMKCSTYWKYKGQFSTKSLDIHSLTNSFFKLYIGRIEVTEIKKYNFFAKKEEESLPLWSEKIERLEYIDWVYPIYFIYKQQKLNSFLEPRFYFDSTTDYYHKENRFTADKLRTHIGVLLQVLRQLVLPTIPYGFDKKDLIEIKSRIEQQIIDYIKNHIKDVPEEGRIDLFDYNREWAFNNSDKEALLPQIARAVNWFSKKTQLIEAIIETQDVIKILTFTEWITSEGIKQKLIEKIKQSDIQSFLEKQHWIPQIQQTLLEIRQYPQLINQINQVVTFWEKNVTKKNKDYEIQLYQTKLLLAYFNEDEQALNAVKEPNKATIQSVNELSYSNYKQFYRALIRLEKDPKSSYKIFNELTIHYPQYPVFAMNRMVAHIRIAKGKDNDLNLYKETIEEWNVYNSKQEELNEELLDTSFIINKLFILLKLEEHKELDEAFNALEMPYQMLPDILEIKIESLIKQKKVEEAISILERAENYHQFSGDDEIEFIKTLKNKVQGVDDVQLLNTYYTRIFKSPPSKLIRIFPENINGNRIIQSFLTKEIARAASKMLDKIVSISEIKSEDKYNDLVELGLDSRINPWGWHVGEQSRGGFSDPENKTTKKQPGERDLPIFDVNKEVFCICEAFVYRTPAPAKSHLKKIFNYYHQRDNLIILIYDLDNKIKSDKNWKSYITQVVPNTKFPDEYVFISCNDVTSDFNYQNSAIKILKSIHKNDVILYHIYVNINYKVS
jgi:hypothetical protein